MNRTTKPLRNVLLLVLITPQLGYAMNIFNPFKACTFSQMQLTLTHNNQPASSAEVIRSVNWKNEKVDTFTTDEDGYVELPAMYQSSITQILPIEFIVAHVITVRYEGQEYKVWVYAKRDSRENNEFNGEPIKLRCELTHEPTTKRAFRSMVKTACTWE